MRIFYLENGEIKNCSLMSIRRLLGNANPGAVFTGLTFELDEMGQCLTVPHVYSLPPEENDKIWLIRHQIVDGKTVATSGTSTTNHAPLFTSVYDNQAPVFSDSMCSRLVSKEQEQGLRHSIEQDFSNGLKDFPSDAHPYVRKILVVLFNAGFMTSCYKDQIIAALKQKICKIKDVTSALIALHENKLLTKKIFDGVVNHANPWECACAVLSLFHQYSPKAPKPGTIKIKGIPFRGAAEVNDALSLGHQRMKVAHEFFLDTVLKHPLPEHMAKIIFLLYQCFVFNINLNFINAIARIDTPIVFNYVGNYLFSAFEERNRKSKSNGEAIDILQLLNDAGTAIERVNIAHLVNAIKAVPNLNDHIVGHKTKNRPIYMVTKAMFYFLISLNSPRKIKHWVTSVKIPPEQLENILSYLCMNKILPSIARILSWLHS